MKNATSKCTIVTAIVIVLSHLRPDTLAFVPPHHSSSKFAISNDIRLTYLHATTNTSNQDSLSTTSPTHKKKIKNNNKKRPTLQSNYDNDDDTSSTSPKKNNRAKMTIKNNRTMNRTKKLLKSSNKVMTESLLPLTDLALGSIVEGHVAGFTSFGIFIKTNYDFKDRGSHGYALLHKSQIRDEPVDDLEKLFRIGAKVKGLRVININYAKGEVGLSLRKQRPKRMDMADVPVGKDIEGTVSKVVTYGAFVDVGADVNALVHISRISQRKLKNIRQVVNEGDKVIIHIISKDKEKKTMAASMLDKEADEYLDRRSVQMKKVKDSVDLDNLKSELDYFEDAVRQLEDALGS